MSLMHHAPWLTVVSVSSLLSHLKEEFVTEIMEEYEEMREDCYAGLEDRSIATS
jgi:5-methyltetrahydrofolate--homocysteine methyltransferase